MRIHPENLGTRKVGTSRVAGVCLDSPLCPAILSRQYLVIEIVLVAAQQEHALSFLAESQKIDMKLSILGVYHITVLPLSIVRRIKVHKRCRPIAKHCYHFSGVTILNAHTAQTFDDLL